VSKTVEEVRTDIPFLKKGITYLDSASTSLKPQPVMDAMFEYFTDFCANIGRGVHRAARMATEAFEATRKKIAKIIGAKPHEIAYAKSTTEAINLVVRGLKLGKGDKVVISRFEHHSNFLPWQKLAEERGVRVEVVGSSRECVVSPQEFQYAIDSRTRVVALCHISNAVGSLQPVKEIVEIAEERGALVLIDAAQSVGHIPVDVKRLGCHYLASPGHKGLMGPPGTGFLYIREGSPIPEPLLIGGGVVKEGRARIEFVGMPQIFDAGTPNIPGIIGLGAGCDYVLTIGVDRIEKHEFGLVRKLLSLGNIGGVEVYGPSSESRRRCLVSFNVRGMGSNEVAALLDRKGFAVRSGHHCAIPLMQHLGVQGTVRASVGYYNTPNEVEEFVEAVGEIAMDKV